MESVPLLRTLVRMPIYWGRLWQAVRQADVVHMFSASYWSFLLAPTPAWIISRVHGRKTILNYHSGEARDHLRRSVLSRAVVRRMDKCVVPSAFLQHVFREFDMSAEVVPNLVDLSQIQYRERKPLRPVIICTRGFEPYYAVDDVVRAFAVVQRECAEAKLILVGSGSQERQIRTLIDELRLSNVELVGSVRHDLNYDRIRETGIGSVSDPNTSFKSEANFNPSGRWRAQFPLDQLPDFERLVGATLRLLGYPVEARDSSVSHVA